MAVRACARRHAGPPLRGPARLRTQPLSPTRDQSSTTTQAREATRATLVTLSELVTAGEAQDLAAQLPDDLESWVAATQAQPATGARFDREGFLRRIAERLPGEVDKDHAGQQAHLVLRTLHEAITPGEWDDLVAQLPDDLGPLLN